MIDSIVERCGAVGGHAFGEAYAYDILDGPTSISTEAAISSVKSAMDSIVSLNLPISKRTVPFGEARRYFEANALPVSAALIRSRVRVKLPRTRCGSWFATCVRHVAGAC